MTSLGLSHECQSLNWSIASLQERYDMSTRVIELIMRQFVLLKAHMVMVVAEIVTSTCSLNGKFCKQVVCNSGDGGP